MSEDKKDRVGIFPSWNWVYWTVVIYGALVIVALTLLTRIFNFGSGP